MKSLYPRNELIVGIALLLAASLVGTANAIDNYSTGNWVWDEALGLNTTYTWNAQSFSGFYYDLDSGTGSEELKIRNIDRNLGNGEIIYTAEPFYTDFEHAEWGSYQVIGFFGNEYFAGYTGGAIGGDVNNSTLIKDGILPKVLTDTDKNVSANSGSALILEEGYALNIVEVDVNGSTVWVQLEKNGEVVDDDFLSSDDNYIYETNLRNAQNVPIIIVHFGTVFVGAETNAVFVEGIFQISDNYIELDIGDRFGEMKITSIGSSGLILENENYIPLDKGNIVDIMGGFKLRVADCDTLRFAPIQSGYCSGTYELRGIVYDENIDYSLFAWTPLNFEGLFYDIDQDVGTEKLMIESLEGRFIPEHKLVYNSIVCPLEFKHREWGNFTVIGLFGEAFVPLLSRGDDAHLSKASRLARLVLDTDDEYTLKTGEILDLGGGYALEARQVDVEGAEVWLEFTRNGEFIDDELISVIDGESGDWFVELDDIEDEDDVIVLRVHVNQVFQEAVESIAQIEGIWLIDYENAFTTQIGDEYGELKVTSIGEGVAGTNPEFGYLEFKNYNPMNLERNSVKPISEVMSFKVADSDSLRFYPFVEITPVEIPYPHALTLELYLGGIEEGDGYQLNNYVIDITDVFVEANSASYYVYEKEKKITDGLLDVGETLEFDFEEYGKVRMRVLYLRSGNPDPEAVVELKLYNYYLSDLYVTEVIDGGYESATFYETYTIHLQKGWNFISTPMMPENPTVNAIFGDYEEVLLPVYVWNPEHRQYYTANTIEVGKGYWVLVLDDTEVTFTVTHKAGEGV